MSIDDLLQDLAKTLTDIPEVIREQLREEFVRTCHRVDHDPRDQQRIDDIADLLDDEENLYEQACAAAGSGDADTAVPLLRRCAEAGIGEAAWLLAQLLEDARNMAEATIWYRRACYDGDPRAGQKVIEIQLAARRRADNHGSTRVDPAAAAQDAPEISEVFTSHAECSCKQTRIYSLPSVDPSLVAANPPFALLAARWLQEAYAISDPDFGYRGPASRDDVAARTIAPWASSNTNPVKNNWLAARERAAWRAWSARHVMSSTARCLVVLGAPGAGKSQLLRLTAPDSLLGTWGNIADHGQPCPVSLFLYTAAQPDVAREPVAADVILPPAEVPECKPDTTLVEALERLVQSGAPALPVREAGRVVGVVTLADLARNINDHLGVPSAMDTVRTLMRPAVTVTADTPLSAVAQAITENGIIAVADPGSKDQPVGYLTAESVLTHAPATASGRPPATPGHPPLLIPGAGVVMLDRR